MEAYPISRPTESGVGNSVTEPMRAGAMENGPPRRTAGVDQGSYCQRYCCEAGKKRKETVPPPAFWFPICAPINLTGNQF